MHPVLPDSTPLHQNQKGVVPGKQQGPGELWKGYLNTIKIHAPQVLGQLPKEGLYSILPWKAQLAIRLMFPHAEKYEKRNRSEHFRNRFRQ